MPLMPSNSSKPLLNRTVLVTCSEKKIGELLAGLESMGARAIPFPVIEIRGLEDTHVLDRALASLHEYSWIVFTSTYGVSFFMCRLKERGKPGGMTPLPKICAIGPATARAVQEAGYEVSLVPERFVAEGIVEALASYSGGLSDLSGQRILLPRAREGRDLLPAVLAASGVRVDVVPCYENVRAEFEESFLQAIRASKPSLIVFTSSSTVRNMIDILGQEEGKRMLMESVIAVLGPVTANTAEAFGKRAEIVPEENTIASLLEKIYEYYGRNK
jgi:uroporphyrinogen III methyltransferase/synthase